MRTRVNYSGLVVAGIGFFLTRFTVALAIYEDPIRFYLGGVVPLALGLGLAAFGVALSVADLETSLVGTTARWCVAGTGAMLVLVFLTVLGTAPGDTDISTLRSRTYMANVLIGGAIGGTLTGLYAARARRQRIELHQQANRLAVLNRMLRHEVLNAVTAIRGYATLDPADHPDARSVIRERSEQIEQTIQEVKHLARRSGGTASPGAPVDIGDCLGESLDRVRARHSEVDFSLELPRDTPAVRASGRLERVFTHLLDNAAVHAADESPSVDVTVSATASSVRVSVADQGPGLPESQQALLETGDIAEFDNPRTGFGLNVVRLLVEEFGGDIETEIRDGGTTVSVVLPRVTDGSRDVGLRHSDLVGVRTTVPHLLVTLGAALAAGVAYGLAADALGGSVSFIGIYYGVRDPVVGWLTHQFHSVVFGFVFAGLVSIAPTEYRDRTPAYVAIGVAWGLVLWVVAAGVVSPVWLRLLGIPAPIPSLSAAVLVTHLVWGATLGALTAAGHEYAVPRLAELAGEPTAGGT